MVSAYASQQTEDRCTSNRRDLPVLRASERLEMCSTNHDGNSSRDRADPSAETASSRDLKENGGAADKAVRGSSEYPSSGCGLNPAIACRVPRIVTRIWSRLRFLLASAEQQDSCGRCGSVERGARQGENTNVDGGFCRWRCVTIRCRDRYRS